jgi:hypothetical protein
MLLTASLSETRLLKTTDVGECFEAFSGETFCDERIKTVHRATAIGIWCSGWWLTYPSEK